MKFLSGCILLIVSSLVLFTCKKDDDPDTRTYPRILTIGVRDVNENGATFEADIISLGSSGITDHGFVWDMYYLPTTSSAGKLSLGAKTQTGQIQATIQSNLITGKKYSVRPYVTDGKHTMYGKEISFVSLGSMAPKITGFTPESGVIGDTITIVGMNFGTSPTGVKMAFGSESASARLVSVSENEIKVVVPNNLHTLTHSLYLTVGEHTVTANKNFTVLTPTITHFYPTVVKANEIIKLYGSNLGKSLYGAEITFGSTKVFIVTISNTEIQVAAPTFPFSTSTNLSVRIAGQELTYKDQIQIQAAWTQKADYSGSTYPTPKCTFSIQNKGYLLTGNDLWEYNAMTDQWSKKANFPGLAREHLVSFTINGKGYLGTGTANNQVNQVLNDFWEYNPETDQWSRKADVGGGVRTYAAGFAIGAKGYIGLGHDVQHVSRKDFWEYDPLTDQWLRKQDFAGTARYSTTGFSSESKGYVSGGYVSNTDQYDVWEYTPATDSWSQKNTKTPIYLSNRSHRFTLGEKQYFLNGLSNTFLLWEYNPTTDQWSSRNFFPENKAFNFAFATQHKIYAGISTNANRSIVWEFDPGK